MGRSFDLLPTDISLDAKERITSEVFSIITSATVEVKRGRTRKNISKRLSLSGNKVDKALQKLIESMQDISALKEFQHLGGTSALVGGL